MHVMTITLTACEVCLRLITGSIALKLARSSHLPCFMSTVPVLRIGDWEKYSEVWSSSIAFWTH